MRLNVLAAVMISLILSQTFAKAELASRFVQFTCSPEIHYFSLHTIALWSADPGGAEQASLLRREGVWEIEALRDKPYICKLPMGEVSVKLTWYKARTERGECAQCTAANFQIRYRDQELPQVRTGWDPWMDGDVLLEISQLNAHLCYLPYDESSSSDFREPNEKGCRQVSLR